MSWVFPLPKSSVAVLFKRVTVKVSPLQYIKTTKMYEKAEQSLFHFQFYPDTSKIDIVGWIPDFISQE